MELIRRSRKRRSASHSQDSCVDLCRGPHVDSTGEDQGVQLPLGSQPTGVVHEKNPMLQRIYGTAWPTQEELDAYLANLAERERRDHRRLGKELDLSQHEEVGAGPIFWHPKGATIRHLIESFLEGRVHWARLPVCFHTPHIASVVSHPTSAAKRRSIPRARPGYHGQPYRLKAMNCPGIS